MKITIIMILQWFILFRYLKNGFLVAKKRKFEVSLIWNLEFFFILSKNVIIKTHTSHSRF